MFGTRVWSLALYAVIMLSGHVCWGQTGGLGGRLIIPHIAAGSFDNGFTTYSTIIEIVNPNPVSVTISGNFYKEDGSNSTLTFTTNLPAAPSFNNGSLAQVTLDPNKSLVISTGTTAPTTPSRGTAAWAAIFASAGVSSVTFLEFRDVRSHELRSRVAVPSSDGAMAKFVVPRIRNASTGLDVAFALVNTAPTSVPITITLRDAAGGSLTTRTIILPGSSHIALFAEEFFQLTNEPVGANYQYIVFDAGFAAQFAAIALAFEGSTQTSIPIDVLR